MQAKSRNVRPWQVCYHQCEAAISVLSWLSWLSSKRAFMIIINVRLQPVWYHDQCETAQACYHESRLSSMWGCNKFFSNSCEFWTKRRSSQPLPRTEKGDMPLSQPLHQVQNQLSLWKMIGDIFLGTMSCRCEWKHLHQLLQPLHQVQNQLWHWKMIGDIFL